MELRCGRKNMSIGPGDILNVFGSQTDRVVNDREWQELSLAMEPRGPFIDVHARLWPFIARTVAVSYATETIIM